MKSKTEAAAAHGSSVTGDKANLLSDTVPTLPPLAVKDLLSIGTEFSLHSSDFISDQISGFPSQIRSLAAWVMSVEEKFRIVRSVGEECIQEDELLNLLTKKPEPVCYDGFEPSGRMHIAQSSGDVELAIMVIVELDGSGDGTWL
ncbi:hypothetical protein TEA_024691 [Camellia sinensis var. sinensis]|uniref:tyrosine--tRNA ligase n=1 Tax=Camellia sinensis var. sinensis TaxID=542762 RepID=A0A4S4D6T9_CAMSN|nr:hypothetical protein TEA_024691 [Camellia sinensis var. sinensis]